MEIKRTLMPESIFKIEHYQNEDTNRIGYLIGLALDCFENPNNDRNSHYFARELMYRGFLNSAIKEFKRHLELSCWDAERSQSLIFIGDCLMCKGKDKEALNYYHKAYLEFANKREPLLKLGKYFFDRKDYVRAVFYLEGSLRIKYSGFYADDISHYRSYPYGMLYSACWWIGDKEKSKEYFDMALSLDPYNKTYLEEAKYYYNDFGYKDNGIDGWMTIIELNFLYKEAKKMGSILEVGSWKGRSTHALLSGCDGIVTAVDHFKGSNDEKDATNDIAKKEDIFEQFINNVGKFKNLKIFKMSSDEAEKASLGKMFDMIFIDGEHTYQGVKNDIKLWKRHTKIMLCGHDYSDAWPEVKRAVNEMIGKPDGVEGSIWWKMMDRPSETTGVAEACVDVLERIYTEVVEVDKSEEKIELPFISIIIPTLDRPDGLKRCLDSIEKINYPKDRLEVIVKEDVPRLGVAKRLNEGFGEANKAGWAVYGSNDIEFTPDCLLEALKVAGDNALVAFNTGELLPDKGNICEHFLIRKDIVRDNLDNKIFDEEFNHIGVDNLLWAKFDKMGLAVRADKAIVKHYHFSKGYKMDDIYNLGWGNVEEDRKLLEKKLKKLD